MKYLPFLAFISLIPACALGRVEDGIEKVNQTIDDIAIAECADTCFDDGQAGNGFTSMVECQDTCDLEADGCTLAEDACFDNKIPQCDNLETSDYFYCRDEVVTSCSLSCDETEEDCFRECGNQATECFNGCLEQLQAELKEINI